MFSRVAARNIAGACIFALAIIGHPLTAVAQWRADVAALDPIAPLSPVPAMAEPFGLDANPLTSGDLLTRWNSIEADVRAESDVLAQCRESMELCPAAAQKFIAVVDEGRAHDGRARIGLINRAINLAIQPMSDLAQWGVPDRWSAPLATLETGRGDCEDYAIAKYAALLASGISADDLRLVIVRDLAVAEDHAVVTVRLEGNWIVLDNRWLTLVEDSAVRRIVPLFVLAHDGVKQFAPTRIAEAPAPPPHGGSAAPGALDH